MITFPRIRVLETDVESDGDLFGDASCSYLSLPSDPHLVRNLHRSDCRPTHCILMGSARFFRLRAQRRPAHLRLSSPILRSFFVPNYLTNGPIVSVADYKRITIVRDQSITIFARFIEYPISRSYYKDIRSMWLITTHFIRVVISHIERMRLYYSGKRPRNVRCIKEKFKRKRREDGREEVRDSETGDNSNNNNRDRRWGTYASKLFRSAADSFANNLVHGIVTW